MADKKNGKSFGRKKAKKIQITKWLFKPEPDITTKELADILGLLGLELNNLDADPGVKRHFKELTLEIDPEKIKDES